MAPNRPTASRFGPPAGRDTGRVSLFFAVSLTGLLVIIGLTFDGAGRLQAAQRAANVAAEAARTGGQAIDVGSAIAGGEKVLDEAAAEQAVVSYLGDVDGAELADVSFDEPGEQDITVVVAIDYDTLFLDLFGFPDTIEVTGTATARLLTTPDP
nr:hypothetical protein [Micromonospora sp. DSM 115978]